MCVCACVCVCLCVEGRAEGEGRGAGGGGKRYTFVFSCDICLINWNIVQYTFYSVITNYNALDATQVKQ